MRLARGRGLCGAALRSAVFLGLGLAALAGQPVGASLFSDDEARKAILELRQRLGQSDAKSQAQARDIQSQAESIRALAEALKAQGDEIQSLRKALLDLNSQLDQAKGELASSRGAQEQLSRELAELQRKQRDLVAQSDERLRQLEPAKVTVDGREFVADPRERRAYEDALAQLRAGDFDAAAASLTAFLRRWPSTGYAESAQFWLGNALYGKRDYRGAIAAFRVTAAAASHPRAGEALLAIANCQIEMKDTKAARSTLAELIKAHPATEAAKAARERLAALR